MDSHQTVLNSFVVALAVVMLHVPGVLTHEVLAEQESIILLFL